MFSISNEELNNLPIYAADIENKEGYFEVIHTNKDGTTEICQVNKGKDSEDVESWVVGGYTTKAGTSYLAVIGGRVLNNINIYTPKENYTKKEVEQLLWEIRNFYKNYKNIPYRHIRPLFKDWIKHNLNKLNNNP